MRFANNRKPAARVQARKKLPTVLKALGSRIRAFRQNRGLSQAEFARRCRINRNYMGNIERGKNNLSLKTMLGIAQQLQIPVSDLCRGIGLKRR